MIRSVHRVLFSLVALVGLAGTANAAYIADTWQDSYDVGTGILVGGKAPSSYSYFHDITLDGFNTGSDLVTDFLLTISLYDDRDDKWYDLEAAFVDIPGVLGDAAVFKFGDDAYVGWSVAGLVELNALGTLSVTLSSLYGDFVFGGSELVANGFTKVANVPEPSTIALLGLGLLGVAAGSRRRKLRA